jgi:hypothetical protein
LKFKLIVGELVRISSRPPGQCQRFQTYKLQQVQKVRGGANCEEGEVEGGPKAALYFYTYLQFEHKV